MKIKNKIDNIFLQKMNPYTKERKPKIKNISIFFIFLLFLFLILGEFMERKEVRVKEKADNYLTNLPKKNSNSSLSGSLKEPPYDDIKISDISEKTYKKSNYKKENFNKEMLIGSKQAVRVLGRVIATSQKFSPIRAKVVNLKNPPQDYEMYFKLKKDLLLLGKARVDKFSERLHITFHTLLVKKKRFSIGAKAFMPDGTFGVKGDFNSGEFKKYGSRFGANFLGGLSQGLKQKSVTSSGAILEASNLKNALLNGISLSFLDYAQDKARSHQNPHSQITIPDKTLFLVYFSE